MTHFLSVVEDVENWIFCGTGKRHQRDNILLPLIIWSQLVFDKNVIEKIIEIRLIFALIEIVVRF